MDAEPTTSSDRDRRAWVLAALEQHEARLLRYALRLAQGNLDEARDAVQHVFMRLCDESPVALAHRLAPWLYRVCRNRVIDLQRQAARWRPLPEVDHSEAIGREPDPALCYETLDDSEQVRRVVATLPSAQQEVVNLWTEGFSYSEISEITGQTAGHLRVLVHRAFQTIRQHPTIRQQLADEGASQPSPKAPVGNAMRGAP